MTTLIATASYEPIQARSGVTYKSDGNRFIYNVAQGDVVDLLNAGCSFGSNQGLQIVSSRGITANGSYQPSAYSRTDLRLENRYQHYTGSQAVSQLQVLIPGFVLTQNGEGFLGNAFTWEAAIESLSPSFYLEAFTGLTNLPSIPDGIPYAASVPIGLDLPANTAFELRQAFVVGSSSSYIPVGSTGQASGDASYVSPSLTSQIPATGAMTQPSGGTGYNSGAACVAGVPAAPMPAVIYVGDSIANGTGDGSGDSYGNIGYIARGLAVVNGSAMAKLGQSVGGWSYAYATPKYAPRIRSFWPLATHILFELGSNDIVNGSSLATLQANAVACWTSAKRTLSNATKKPLQVAQTLLLPRTTSVQRINALPTISAGGTGYAASSTFNVTIAGGTLASGSAATVNVTTNGSGVVTTVNSYLNNGAYTSGATPSTPNSPTGGAGSGLSLGLSFGGWTSAADQTPVSGFATNGIRDQFNNWVKSQVGQGLLDVFIDPNPYVEDQASHGVWATNGTANYPTTDGIHPTATVHALSAQAVNAWASTITP